MTVDKTKLPEEFLISDGEQEFYTRIGKMIHDMRIAKNISQAEIAEQIDTTPEFVDAYEKAEIAIPFHQFMEIGRILNCFEEVGKIMNDLH